MNPLYKGLQDDIMVIKCAHADGGPFDDPYYIFSLDHIVGIREDICEIAGDEKSVVLYIIDKTAELIREGNSGEIAAFTSTCFHFFDMYFCINNGDTFRERHKTLVDSYGEKYKSVFDVN